MSGFLIFVGTTNNITCTTMNIKMSSYYYLITLLVFSVIHTNTFAQNEPIGKFRSFSIQGHSGAHIYSGETLDEELQYGYGAIDVRYSWQPSTDTEWARDTGYASYGIGFYSASIGDPQVFGNPNALYGFVNFYLSNPFRRNTLELSPALGLTYNLNPFNPETNPLNDAIGSRISVYFSLHFGGAYKVNRDIDFLYGIDFTHFSNGRTYMPNYGLNLFGFNLGMRYNFNALQNKHDKNLYTTNVLPSRFQRSVRPKSPKNAFGNSMDIYAAIGTTQNDEDAGTSNRYGNFTGSIDYRHYFNKMHGASIGLDFMIDGSLAAEYPDSGDHFLLGAHAGYDFMFWKLDVRVQAGTYLTDSRGKGNFYLRPAIQYELPKNLFAQIGLKTSNGAAADWIEFGIGWKPFKW
ncbi:acyloxyacyl hydrolase [Cognatitamlana onchidii]|uniref:acyloxyacyl hydrolase n=1 Tax=Cognatitamlana onchidii TaxID=2562860 RepID=UPI0010A5E41F|nr:acyloxyacyl hydrolase [Algibacter onchidii]